MAQTFTIIKYDYILGIYNNFKYDKIIKISLYPVAYQRDFHE